MNHSKFISLAIGLVLVMLVVAGCATPQATPVSTPEPQVCPTTAPQSCPTVAAQVQPSMDAWRIDYADSANVRITFSPGDKCSMDIMQPVTNAEFGYEIVVDDQTYQNYVVVALTLDEGKTIADLEEYDEMAIGVVPPPSFSDIRTLEVVPPMSRTWHGMDMPVSPIYFVCIIEGPDAQRAIDEFGPVDIAQ